jgi:putative membrane protein
MLHHLIHLLVTAVAVLIAARIVPGVRVRSFGSAVVFAFVLAVLNVILGKILIVLALPFVLLTLGLFLIVINGFLFWLADKIVKGVECDGFGSALLGSLVTSVVSWGILWALGARHLHF